MRASEFITEASVADQIRAEIAKGQQDAAKDRYADVPSGDELDWIKAIPDALTGNIRGKYRDMMDVSAVVQNLKKQDPKKYGFDKWTPRNAIALAKELMAKNATGNLPQAKQDQEDQEQVQKDLQKKQQDTKSLQDKAKKTAQDIQRGYDEYEREIARQQAAQQSSAPQTVTQPQTQPQPVKSQEKPLPPNLQPLTSVERGAKMTFGKNKLTFDGSVWRNAQGDAVGNSPQMRSQLNQAFLDYENTKRQTQILDIQAQAAEKQTGNR